MKHSAAEAKKTESTSLVISWGSFVYSIVAILYCAATTTDPLGTTHYLSLLTLAATLLLAPALVSFHLTKIHGTHWYTSDGILTLACLGLVFLLGFNGVIGGNILIILLGFSALALSLSYFIKSKTRFIGTTLLALACGLFFIFFFFSSGYHSTHFTENVIQGLVHMDTLFHAAISNLNITYHKITTGIHGTPQLKYHAGSQILFGGLSRLLRLGPVDFYNTGYAVVFVPLYFKSFFLLASSLVRKEWVERTALVFFSLFLVLLYSAEDGFLGYMKPLVSESNTVAITLAFLLLSSISQSQGQASSRTSTLFFYLFSFTVILWITATKVSVGFVVFGSLSYLLLRTARSFKTVVATLAPAAICWALFIVGFIYNTTEPSVNANLLIRYMTFWSLSGGLLGYTLGFLVSWVVAATRVNQSEGTGFISLIREKRLLDCELLCVATLLGLMGATMASNNRSDAAYFASIQLYPSFALAAAALFPLSKYLLKPNWPQTIICTLIAVLALASTPKIQLSHLSMQVIRKNAGTGNAPLRQLIGHLKEINAESGKNKKFIYIPLDQKWFYYSQRGTPLGGFFIVPAYSGVAMLAGIPPGVVELKRYSFPLYKNAPPPYDLTQAQEDARNRGAQELIAFWVENGKLVRTDIQLSPVR